MGDGDAVKLAVWVQLTVVADVQRNQCWADIGLEGAIKKKRALWSRLICGDVPTHNDEEKGK